MTTLEVLNPRSSEPPLADGEIDWQLTEALANAQAQQLSGRPL